MKLRFVFSLLALSLLLQPIHSVGGSWSDEFIANELISEPENRLVAHGPPSELVFQANENIKLLVWNIQKKSHPKFLTTFTKLLKNSHISLIQETLLNSELSNFYESSNFSWWTGVSFKYRSSDTGVSSGSLFLTENHKALASKVKEPLSRTSKMALIFDLPIDESDQVIKFINIHGINFVGAKKFEKHIKQVLKEVETYEGPLVFAGDFNNWSSKKTKKLNKLIKKHNLYQIPLDKDFRSRRSDHIFIRGLEVIRVQVLQEIKESDHKPIIAELRLSAPNNLSY